MKHALYVLTLMVCLLLQATDTYAQRISHTYNNMSLSEALLGLNNEQTEYVINFLYNELEDFRITTIVSRKTVPDAIQQMIGFYPVRMTVKSDDREIYVECTHKTDRRLTGTIIDEQGKPVAYANVTILNPADSTLLSGGVSNESGYFAIPYKQPTVLTRISYVGYKTIYKICNQPELGTIRLQPETIRLNGVQVTGEHIVSSTENGHIIYNMPMLLQFYPADNAYDALTSIPGLSEMDGTIMFSGRMVTLIINGKATTLSADKVVERLKQMPAAMLAKAEVMPSAPAKYHVRGMAINIITKDFTGTNQLSGQLMGGWRQHKYGTGYAGGSIIYNHGKLGIDASYKFTHGTGYGQVEHEANHPLNGQRVSYSDKTRNRSDGTDHDYRIGMDYAISDDHRLSLNYTGQWNSTRSTNTTTGTAQSVQNSRQHTYLHNVDASYVVPFGLQLGVSYTNYQEPSTQHLVGKLNDISRNLNVDSRQKVSKWLFTADQTHALPKGWELSYGGKAQFTNNNSYQTTFDASGHPLSDATSRVDYDERILNGYIGLSKQIGQSLSLETSVTAEQYHATKWNEWRIYPQFNAMWNVNDQNMLNLSFSSEAVYPTYWSTMSSIYYASAYSEIWGNPDLRPMSEYDINLMWQLNRKYTFTAFAILEPDYFVQMAYQPTDRMAVIMKETNFDYSNYFGLQASAQFRIGNWLNGNINATALYRHDKTQFFDLPIDRARLSGILGGMAVARLSQKHNIQFILNPFFQTRAIQGVYDINPFLQLNATLRYTSKNSKWSLVAKGENILNAHMSTSSTIANQNYAMRVWRPYTKYSFTAIYRIGNFKEKQKKEVDTSRMGY
ncbi:MAG: TonB-dependent receptor family protein [Prevotella sp.]|nr:TonB-dependent receptor family protein [Prevotella sp.]